MVQMDDSLEPSTQEIFRQQPRLRVLVLGKSGVGKSSLINKTFGTDIARVSEGERGVSDINLEILSINNSRFVLHDSDGFEAGEDKNLSKLVEFIQARVDPPVKADRLDFIWLCIQTPCAGARTLEHGTEVILSLLVDLKVSFIIVFTKFDKLVEEKEYKLMDSQNSTDVEQEGLKAAQEDYDRFCVHVIARHYEKKGLGDTPPMINTSVDDRETLQKLVRLTSDSLHVPYYSESSSAIENQVDVTKVRLATAQAVDPTLKIRATIEVGREKYWAGLASSAHFPGYSRAAVLRAIHFDMITIWNIADPDQYLLSDAFLKDITKTVMRGAEEKAHLKSILAGASTVAGIVAGATAPVAPITGPVVFAGILFAAWVYNTVDETPRAVQCMMGYIIDLSNILELIFDARASDSVTHISKHADTAREAYEVSREKDSVHTSISVFVKQMAVWKVFNKVLVIDEIERLLTNGLHGGSFPVEQTETVSARQSTGQGKEGTAIGRMAERRQDRKKRHCIVM